MLAQIGEVVCNHCGRIYSRPEHLRRHLQSHLQAATHECRHCHRSFKRKDVLRRHSTTCIGLSAHTALSDRACHRCANKKRKCSHQVPSCKSCITSGQQCQYPVETQERKAPHKFHEQDGSLPLPGLETSGTDAGSIDIEAVEGARKYRHDCSDAPGIWSRSKSDAAPFPQHDLTIKMLLEPNLPKTPPTTSFTFLLQFTMQYSLKGCFGVTTDANSTLTLPKLSMSNDWYLIENSSGLIGNAVSTFSTSSVEFGQNSFPYDEPGLRSLVCNNASYQIGQPLVRMNKLTTAKSWEMYSAMRKVLPKWSEAQELCYLHLFSPGCIALALDLYWSEWHPNWPVLHRPTFDAEKTPIPLLAAMIVIGSCYKSLEHARYWFDAVENLAFDELTGSLKHHQSYHNVQRIQAAYLACIFQTWDGTDESRLRIRRYRFRNIVTAVRALDMGSAKHESITDLETFNWIVFIRQEETIRTLLWVFLLDTAYVIFNNIPPQFALRELHMGLASCEACFQAQTSQECFSLLRYWLAHNKRSVDISLYGLIKLFFKDQLSQTTLDDLAHESFINLWCVNSAFHIILFNLDPVLGGESQFDRLTIGIETWEAVWNRRLENNDEKFFDLIVTTAELNPDALADTESWKRPGFWKNAAEYWLLARVTLDRMVAAHQSAMAADELSGMTGSHLNLSSQVHDRVEYCDMQSLHSFLGAVDSNPVM